MRLIQHARALAGMFLLTSLLAACSTTFQTARLMEAPPAGLPPQAELTDTPFFAQERYQCGPAALATMLVQRGIPVSADELVDKVYLPEREGSVTIEMEAAARRYGMVSYPLRPEMQDVLLEIAAGNPVLVLQNLGLNWWPRWHYAVVIGYDLHEGTLILRSGVIRRYKVSMSVFETTWNRGQAWARVMTPPHQIPASANALDFIRAGLSLEQSGQPEAALHSYRAATQQWPNTSFAWLARGNLAYKEQRYDEAEASFRAGIQSAPTDASFWNNLGYALARQQCRTQALDAVRCALALDSDNPVYRDSLRELSASASDEGHCEHIACPLAPSASSGTK